MQGGGDFRSADERRATRLHYPLDAGLLHTAAQQIMHVLLSVFMFLLCCGYFEIECCSVVTLSLGALSAAEHPSVR